MLGYPEIYASYVKFCNMVGHTPPSFEDWMHAREAPVQDDKREKADRILSLVE